MLNKNKSSKLIQKKKSRPYVNLEPEEIGREREAIKSNKKEDPQISTISDWPMRKTSTIHEYESLTTEEQDNEAAGASSFKKSVDESGRKVIINDLERVRMRRINPEQKQVGMAVFPYKAQYEDELTLKRGSLMEIVNEQSGEDGWVLARLEGEGPSRTGHTPKVGMVPRDYVALMGCQPELIKPGTVQKSTDRLGSGGFADVYRGTFNGQEVALKLPRAAKDGGAQALKREALILSRLRHDNIVRFFGMSLDPLFIVLELCEGGTLFSLNRKMGSSDVLTVINWAKQVASAIEHMHSRDEPLVYADMKAENVLIKERHCECGLKDESWKNMTNYHRNGTCRNCGGMCINNLTLKLADFNVTRTIGVKRDSFSGSLPWMSPEVIQNKDAHPSADIWSFGMFLYELLNRKVPYNNCEVVLIMSTIISKEGPPLPLPIDLPIELRDVFDGCWRRKDQERPSITEVRAQLERAEQTVDNNYKWILPDESQREAELERERLNAELVEDLRKSGGKPIIKIPLCEGIMCLERLGGQKPLKAVEKKWGLSLTSLFQPPEPIKRQKKPAKLNKDSISTPIDFRHHVSAKVRESTDEDGNALDKTLIIRYTDDELPVTLAIHRQHHRSHDSLLDYGGRDVTDDTGNESAFSTLPRAFRHQQSRSTDEQPSIKAPPLPRKPLLGLNCRPHPCCTKLAAKLGAKSEPELNMLGAKPKMGGLMSAKVYPAGRAREKLFDQSRLRSTAFGHPASASHQIYRRHDYLSLMPSACINNSSSHQQHILKMKRDQKNHAKKEEKELLHQKDRLEPDGDGSSMSSDGRDQEEEGISPGREYVNIMEEGTRKLSRANAIRQRVIGMADEGNGNKGTATTAMDSSESTAPSNLTTPTGGAESTSSSDLSGFVVVGDSGGETVTQDSQRTAGGGTRSDNRRRGKESQQQALSDFFNRRVSPPQQHQSLSPSTATPAANIHSRRSTSGEWDKLRREEISNSTFYVPSGDDPEEGGDDHLLQTPSDEHCATIPSRRRSTASSTGGGGGTHRSITSLISNLIGGGGRSPRNLTATEETEERAEGSANITEARCFHPHHVDQSSKDIDQFHLCALRSAAGMLPEISLYRMEEMPQIEFTRWTTLGRQPHNHLPHKIFVKKADYPDKQRQRHRTESSTQPQLPPTIERRKANPGEERGSRISRGELWRNIDSPMCSLAPPLPGSTNSFRHSRTSHGDLSILNTTIPLLQPPPPPLPPPPHTLFASPIPLQPQHNPSLLSPERAQFPWHQRSRSSDTPGGKPSASELADLLRCHPMPSDGLIVVNPSYVPMQEGNNTKKASLENPASTNKLQSSTSQIPTQPSPHSEQRPVPRPRTNIPNKSLGQWPTSQAPTLNRNNEQVQQPLESPPGAVRPSTLCLAPPPQFGAPNSPGSPSSTPTTSASLFTNSSNSLGHSNTIAQQQTASSGGGGCDSGLCASSGGGTEGECSPHLPPPHHQPARPSSPSKECSFTTFSCSPGDLPTTVVVAGGSSSADSFRYSRAIPTSSSSSSFPRSAAPVPIPPPPTSAPPPIPPKQHEHHQQQQGPGPRVPPLPRNGWAMRGGEGQR